MSISDSPRYVIVDKPNPSVPPGTHAIGVHGANDAWVRPGEVIVDIGAQAALDSTLRTNGGQPYVPGDASGDWRRRPGAPDYGDINARLERANVGFRLWTGFDNLTAVNLVSQISSLHFNTVMTGVDFYQGGPGGIPAAVAAPSSLGEATGGDGLPDIAVLDTGLPNGWLQIHQELKKGIVEVGADTDPLNEDGDTQLDRDAGHGLFICGLILRMAPDLTIQNSRVLHSTGDTDDTLVCAALGEATAKVINLSLGGYSVDDLPSALLVAAVNRAVLRGQVIVAAAGNASGVDPVSHFFNRPFWPAALPNVIAVGAYDSKNGGQVLWPHSNAADVYAPGVDVHSSYVDGWASPDPAGKRFAGWASWSGTSFAAPVVAAQIAKQVASTPGGVPWDIARSWLTAQTPQPWPKKPNGVTAVSAYHPAIPEPTGWV